MLTRDITRDDRWTMFDRMRAVGVIERVTVRGRECYRGWDPEGIWVLGYAPTLDAAAKKLWAWDVERRRA